MSAVSVVIPVYNAGKYLEETMGCIIEQTMRDMEIICVNDASTDNSLQMLEAFADKDRRVTIINNGCNQGAAVSRNIGLDKAQGEYICFLDADDIFEKDMVEKEHNAICKYNADIAVVHSAHFRDDPRKWSAWEFPWEEQCVSMENNDTGQNLICAWEVAPWNKMYKKQFLERYQLSYQDLQSSNDVYFAVMAVLLAENIVLVGSDKPMVLYRAGTETQISAKRTPMDAYLAFEHIYDSMMKWNIWEKYFESFFSFFYSGMDGQHKSCKIETENQRVYEYIGREGSKRLGFFEIPKEKFKNKRLYDKIYNYLYHPYDSGSP